LATHPELLPALTPGEQRELLSFARLALERVVRDGEALDEPPPDASTSPRLLVPQGAFVSLHRGPVLRGCVGFIEPARPLVSAVMENAMSAARSDFRFPPVEPHELAEIQVEISVMGPLEPISPDRVTIGVHGLMVERGGRRGLLLPQVAAEHHWDRDTFLRQVCVKAGLPDEAWRQPDTRLFAFTAQVFGQSSAREGAVG
jgi:AmmeMemoRadiSam system protein A